jgi:micrococcal nuclease
MRRIRCAILLTVALLAACSEPIGLSTIEELDDPPHVAPDHELREAAQEWPEPPERAVTATVARVIDGDTVVLRGIDYGSSDRRTGGRRTRLIGFDTPEVHGELECYGQEASAFARYVLDGRDVLVDHDAEQIDRYGRALAYVWDAETRVLFNARVLWEGYATQLTIPPNVRYADLFRELAADAREADRGLWTACP